MRSIVRVLVFFALLAAPAAAQEAKRGFEPADWYRLKTVGSPAISPDGRFVAFTVTTVKESENERHTEVWMVATDGSSEPVRLTTPAFSATNPRWSPDGTHLYFNSQRPGGKGSTWALRLDQPYQGEAFQPDPAPPNGSEPEDHSFVVTTDTASNDVAEGSGRGGSDSGPTEPADSSGGDGQDDDEDDPFAEMQPMARPPFGSITKPLDPDRFDGRHVLDLPYKANGRGFVPNRREARRYRPSQIWVKGLDGDTTRQMITDAEYSHEDATVSPDGRWIAFTADPQFRPDSAVQAERDSIDLLPYDAERDEAPRNDDDLFVLSVEGGEPRRITTMDGSEDDITWSPDSRRIAFLSRVTRTSNTRLWLTDLDGSAPRDVLGDWRYEPNAVEWMADGAIAMTAAVGGRTALFHVDAESGEITEVIGGRRRINGFSYDEEFTKVAFVATSIDAPTELYLADIDGGNERRLTGMNDSLNAEIAWPTAERFTYESVGGFEIEAWLQYPFDYEPGRRYPLVLYIHGGPHSAYGEGWFDEFHNLSGAGMFVLFTNPRGSNGYGADFTYSTRGRWGKEDYEDLMKAADIVAQRPDVDSTRMGVSGGSYGGFMTAWITTRTDRFKAAQTDRMISNWISWYGSSEAQGLTEFEFYGKPWDNLALYEELSPIRYVQNVKTPTLIVQSEEDHRTPMADAEQWFMALEKQGVPVELVRYPRSNHNLSRTGEPWLLVDRLGRLRQWFLHWLGDEPAAAEDR